VDEGALEEGGGGAEPHRLGDRHAGVDAEPARAVRRRLHHAALVPPAAHHQQLDPAQLRVPLAADLDEKRVQIHVENAGAHAIFDPPTYRSSWR
jgi:hypothetical protein